VAQRTVLRKVEGEWESWGDVADRVAWGNVSLAPGGISENMEEYAGLRDHIANGRILMSGRHLQHGDGTQKYRNMEMFTNCSTACTSALSLQLLLQGSGVGRCYDDDMMVVDWHNAPMVVCSLSPDHADYDEYVAEREGIFMPLSVQMGAGDHYGECVTYVVEDSREGWAKALELWETMAYIGQSDKVLVLDFSNVRPKGAPIGGMQGRPSSGPMPLMQAFIAVRDTVVRPKDKKRMPLWKQAMYVDHYFAESVLVGGVRRAARIATKYWKDPDILEFIKCKEPIQFEGKTLEEKQRLREEDAQRMKEHGPQARQLWSRLWSANNSVGVDEEFWEKVSRFCNKVTNDPAHAREVFSAITSASYYDGEPGFLNLHKLNFSEEGLDWEELKKGEYVGSKKYQVSDDYKKLLGDIAGRVEHKKWKAIVNPCGEIVLNVLGGFCVIADVVPYHCKDQEEFEDAVRAATRALIRVNTMDSIYSLEVQRTNRIGVGVTGIHEWLWNQHHTSFSQISTDDSKHVFRCLTNARRVAERSAVDYSTALGKSSPHTVTTIKPAGTTSKLFGLTEGCHLPAMPYYMRWVQKRSDDPLVKEYADRGYPTKELSTYKGMTAVGFPTKPLITDLIPEDKLVCAGEATMEEQFAWLRLLEENWLGPDKGNQISYTLKFSPDKVSLQEFQQQMLEVQNVRCVSVLPQADISVYEYLPESEITKEEYEEYMANIQQATEDVSREHLECGSGGCPIDYVESK
jgi:adenosylcobalamin-dependent ribonucleoside-triphosphate reductase